MAKFPYVSIWQESVRDTPGLNIFLQISFVFQEEPLAVP